MILHQYYLGCLSHASYMIGDETTGRAIVVDPRRDITEYVADADRYGLTIEAVINTHIHADFVSGHLELAAATGAWIGLGEGASTDYPIRGLGPDTPRTRFLSPQPPGTSTQEATSKPVTPSGLA